MVCTGKSLLEALIFASTNPQYDDRLFTVHENCKLRIPAEHVVYTHCYFCFVDIQNNFGTQHVLQMLRTSEKDLTVLVCPKNFKLKSLPIIEPDLDISFDFYLQ